MLADLQFLDSFDAYNGLGAAGGIADRWTGNGGVTSAGNSFQPGRFGGQCYRFAIGNFTAQLHKLFKVGAVNRIAGGCSFRAVSITTAARALFGASVGTTVRAGFGVSTTGQLILFNNTATVINTTVATPFIIGNFHTCEWELDGATAKFWVDGTLVMDLAGLTLNMTGVDGFFTGQRFSSGGTAGTYDIDDLHVQGGATASRLGVAGFKVDVIRPSADVTHDFTHSSGASGFGVLDETLVDATDFNEGSVLNDTDLFELGNLAGLPIDVQAVQIVGAALRSDAAFRSLKLIGDIGGAQTLDTDWALPTTLGQRELLMTAKPGGGAWAPADVNLLRAGYKVTL